MGCDSCASGSGGKPGGCKSNGGCSTGGCNRMNVHNWLRAMPLHDGAKPYNVMEVSFNKGSRKDFYKNNTHNIFEKGEWIAVEGISGFDIGQVSLIGELVKLQMKKYSVTESDVAKRILRIASDEDMNLYRGQKDREAEVLILSRAIARTHNLEMKICEVEIQADGKKATFFYTADQRVDFRELIKALATEFKLKVEMRQIGARQESGKVGGIGSCGRELCCSTWLTDFKSVNTTAARYQNLSINQTKLSGQCGRLKCCLNYELDTYMDALRVFPDNADTIETLAGVASLQKRDIFKNLMWYSFSNSSKQYPLTITRVKEIQQLNKQGVKPDELQAVELEVNGGKPIVKVDVGFVNDVGLTSLKALEKGGRKDKRGDSRQGQPNTQQKQGQPKQNKQARPQNSQPKEGQAEGQPKSGQPRPPRPERLDRPQGNPQQARPQQGKQQQARPAPNPNQPQQPRPAPNPNQQKPQVSAEQGGDEANADKPQRSRNKSRNRNRGPRPQGQEGPQPPAAE